MADDAPRRSDRRRWRWLDERRNAASLHLAQPRAGGAVAIDPLRGRPSAGTALAGRAAAGSEAEADPPAGRGRERRSLAACEPVC